MSTNTKNFELLSLKVLEKKSENLHEILTKAYKDFERGLNQYSFFKIHDPNRSQDLVQETFLKAWKYLKRGGKIEMMKSFLYHVLNDLIIDEYRKQKHQVTSLDVLVENGFEQTAGDHGRILNVMDGEKAAKLIEELPEKYQRVLKMRYLHSLTLEEISDKIGQPKNTIAVQVHRGLEKLKALYESSRYDNSPYDGSSDNMAFA
jgi:RNA polymerase sigma factor (sigma-70 family)